MEAVVCRKAWSTVRSEYRCHLGLEAGRCLICRNRELRLGRTNVPRRPITGERAILFRFRELLCQREKHPAQVDECRAAIDPRLRQPATWTSQSARINIGKREIT